MLNKDITYYINLLDDFSNKKELSNEELSYLNNYDNIKTLYKIVNDYDKHVLLDIPFFDESSEEYYHIITYRNKIYRISSDDLNDTYSIRILKNLDEEQDSIIPLEKVIDYYNEKQSKKGFCRTKTKKQ